MSNYDVDVTPEPVLMRTFVYCLERATEKYGFYFFLNCVHHVHYILFFILSGLLTIIIERMPKQKELLFLQIYLIGAWHDFP